MDISLSNVIQVHVNEHSFNVSGHNIPQQDNFGELGAPHDFAVHYLGLYILFSIIQQRNESKLYPQTIAFSTFLIFFHL